MVYLIFRFLYAFAFSVNFLMIARNLSNYRIKKYNLLCIVINTIMFLLIKYHMKEFLLLPMATLINLYVIYINSKKILYSLFISILADLVFAISEVMVMAFISMIFQRYASNIIENSLQHVIILLPILILSYIISKLLKVILKKVIEKDSRFVKKTIINPAIIFYVVFALITIYINTIIYRYFTSDLNAKFLIVNAFTIVCNIFIVIILIYNNNKTFESRLQQEYKDREIQQLQEYVETIENLSDDLRKFKHDYMNILNAMGIYIEFNDIDGLKKFYKEELLPESKKIMVNDTTPYLLKNMKINLLKGLISSKIVTAHSNDIQTSIEIVDEIDRININNIDICRIIGIFFDNAIEAAALCSDKSIYLAVIKNNEHTSFIVKNTCPLDVPPIHKLKEKGFSTKGNGRGLGLATVDDIVNKEYTNLLLRTKAEDGVFIQELIITNI